MQKCEWCGKIFHTTRHECKFDPDKKNCFSCKNFLGIGWDSDFGWDARTEYADCNQYGTDRFDELGLEDTTDLEAIKKCRYNMQCPLHELMEGYEGKKTLKERT